VANPPAEGSRRSWAIDCSFIAGLTTLLILPLYWSVYFDNWGSIESTFIAQARFLSDNWPNHSWQPLWYGGTRFDYIYPPALPYGTAGIAGLFEISFAQAYHVYIGVLYTVGIVGVYFFVRVLSNSRWMAWTASAVTALASPSFPLIDAVRVDAASRFFPPQRLNALIHYGEGPHISSLSLVPIALALSWLVFQRPSAFRFSCAAALCALVVTNNFYGATTLALLYSLLVWTHWLTRPARQTILLAIGIPILAYGLTASWLTLSYLNVTLSNLAVVAASGNSMHLAAALAVLLGYLACSFWYGRLRPETAYAIFVCGAAIIFLGLVMSHYWFGLLVVGTPARYIPELDLALTLLALLMLHRGADLYGSWAASSRWRGPAALGLTVLLLCLTPYPRNAWKLYGEDPHPEERVEFQLSRWIDQNLPDTRVFVDGSLRIWYDVWHDLPQLGGGSDQGMLNQEILAPIWAARMVSDPAPAILLLRAFGVGAIVVHDETSQEVYHSFAHPKKFDGVLRTLYDNSKGDTIYEVPRRFPQLARVVSRAAAESLRPFETAWDQPALEAYVDVLETGPDKPVELVWKSPVEVAVTAELHADELLLLQISYDPYWRAYVDGESIEVRRDLLGQLILDAPPGEHTIRMVFETPLENKIGGLLSLVSLLAVFWLAGSTVVRRRALSQASG